MIIENKAKCRKCGEVVESKHRHDWVACKCEAIYVDGGKDYIRRGGKLEDIEELSTFAKNDDDYVDDVEELQERLGALMKVNDEVILCNENVLREWRKTLDDYGRNIRITFYFAVSFFAISCWNLWASFQ